MRLLRIGLLAGVLSSALTATQVEGGHGRPEARPGLAGDSACAHQSRLDRPKRFSSIRS